MDAFTIHFTPSPQDYVKTYRMLQFRNPFSRLVYGMLLLFELCLVGSLFLPSSGSARLWPVAIGIVVFLALAIALPAYNVGRKAKANERMLADTTWELNDQEIRMTNRFAERKYDWGSFQGLFENKEYFFLRHSANKRLYNFIPKRAFASAEQMAAFRELFNQHTHASKGPAVPNVAGG